MIKKILIGISIAFVLLSSISILKIDNTKKISAKYTNKFFNSFYKQKNNNIGYIEIKKIQLKEKLYDINSPNNNVNKNVTILKESVLPPKENSIIYIAAHSGTGPTAYFENLNKLELNDEIVIYINNNKFLYQVSKIWNEQKNGYIHIPKSNNINLVLTTCNPKNDKLQLILSCTKKES